MEIRRAAAEELAAIGELTVTAYAGFTTGADDFYVEHLRDAAARDREAELWVAEHDGALVGTVTIAPEGSPWRELGKPGEGEFRMLAVAPAARGRGVGEALVRHALDRFRAAGNARVVLCSLVDMDAAHRIYQRLGFERAPELDWSPEDGVDLIAYRLELT
ncbi:MAG: GNAT family N-acetyltransferase [Nocardioides sp.]